MRKLQKSFLKKTLEVYYSQSINKISTQQLIKNSQKIERAIQIKMGNGKLHNLRFKHYCNHKPPYEWTFYRNNSNTDFKFLPEFLMGSKLKSGEFIYFLEDYPNKDISNNPDKFFDSFPALLISLKEKIQTIKSTNQYFNNFKNYLNKKNDPQIVSFFNNHFNSKDNFEISCLFNKKNLSYSNNFLKIMDLNNLNYHIPGFSFWSLYKDSKKISIDSFFRTFLNNKEWNYSLLKKLSFWEYSFKMKYEKKEY